ncbi:MAG: hypothetical protein PHP97_00720 [Candidatus Shapirobacteria bacterium]|nr:hypothetical protein [Candidatus Shapirobacteria bacterium]MDD3002386.1 hypothetical protein [Candidatus Shapirobacteria bacterium]MDD4383306.1 hypothetical protein [Candidatus Shapirobacteria bacterium]
MFNILEHSPYETFVKVGGVYKSPEDRNENYLGPLVAYDDIYIDVNGNKKNYVGFYYYNTAPIEQLSKATEYFSSLLAETIKANLCLPSYHLIASQEDFVLVTDIDKLLLYPISFFKKRVLAVADPEHGKKEESFLFYDRQNIQVGGNYIIFEGVCNNFFTTKQMIDLIESAEGNVIAIACVINRSKKKSFYGIPILSVVHIPTPQYRQDDPIVKKLIEECNIVWEPKKYWSFLQEEMRKCKK